MKVEELELLEKLLPKNSLWKIQELCLNTSHSETYSATFECEGLMIAFEILPSLSIATARTNFEGVRYDLSKNQTVLVKHYCSDLGLYLSLEGFLGTVAYSTARYSPEKVKILMQFLEETGGPSFMAHKPFNEIYLIDQSNDVFVPVTRTISSQ